MTEKESIIFMRMLRALQNAENALADYIPRIEKLEPMTTLGYGHHVLSEIQTVLKDAGTLPVKIKIK